MHAMEYYLALQGEEILPATCMNETGEHYAGWNHHTQEDKCHMISLLGERTS
jgi:hypothetical protein